MSGNGELKSFGIIKQRGDPNVATTVDGHKVHRKESVYIPEVGQVRCAPYSSHFVFIDPEYLKGKEGRWFSYCTCGSVCVVTGYDAYMRDQSYNEGAMLVCKYHAEHGHHLNEKGSQWA